MYPHRASTGKTGVRAIRAPGFTLIELLVVVSIILILMAALMPIYSKVQLKARREATQAMIMALAGSLERYRVEFDCYPPNAATGTEDDGTLFATLNGKDNRGIVANLGTPRERRYEPFLTLGKEYYKSDPGGNLFIVDSWGMAIHYFNCKAYIEEKNGDPKNCYNPAGVDIYSTGQDKQKDPDLVEPGSGTVKLKTEMKLVDDITNF
jgi:prepilin-type N-terminal cleavage/methylation domain-containing protein